MEIGIVGNRNNRIELFSKNKGKFDTNKIDGV
jgi:hypothetical protein